MSSSFFYSQDHDCSVCSSSLHPTLLSPSLMSAWEDVSSIIDLYWQEDPYLEMSEVEQSTTKALPPLPPQGAPQTSDLSIASIRSAPNSPTYLLSSSASTITSTSSSSSSSSTSTSSFSRRFRLKKAISNLSLRHKSSDHDLPPRSAKSDDGRNPVSQPSTPTLHPPRQDSKAYGVQTGIHPYNFFESSLNMSADYSVLEDGWLRLRTESRLR
jgi:hypothetical protein